MDLESPLMNAQTLLNGGATIALAMGGWLARQLWVAIQAIELNIHKIETDLPLNYIRKDEFGENMREMKDMLLRIMDKLDRKVDK